MIRTQKMCTRQLYAALSSNVKERAGKQGALLIVGMVTTTIN